MLKRWFPQHARLWGIRVLVVVAWALVLACGGRKTAESFGLVQEQEREDEGSGEREMVAIALSLDGDSPQAATLTENGLFLTSATSLVVSISGCASGFSKTHNTAIEGSSLKLYKRDLNCVASLESFVLWGLSWTKEGGGGFSGEGRANFVSGARVLSVGNPGRLSSPLAAPTPVRFNYSEILPGNEQFLAKLSPGPAFTDAGGNSPNLNWYAGAQAFELSSVDYSSGIATFSVKMECQGTWFADLGTPLFSRCYVASGSTYHAMGSYRVMLLKDDKNDGAALTRNAIETLFANGPYVGVGNADVFQPANGRNGGFTVSVSTPLSLAACRSWLLAVERYQTTATSRSYALFNVDLSTSATTCP